MTLIRIIAARGRIVIFLRSSRTTAVLSIGRLGVATGADYYVANSVDDYYLGTWAEEKPPDSGSVPRRLPST